MAKILSVKSKPYNPQATLDLMYRHQGFVLARYTLRKTPTGLQCFVQPQSLHRGMLGQYTFVAAGAESQQIFRTRDPEIDGPMLVQTLATMRHPGHPNRHQARTLLKFLNQRKKKDHLPKDLVYLVLGLHLNALDFKRQVQGPDAFTTATESLLASLFSTPSSYRTMAAGLRQLRSDLYQNISTGLSYVEKLISDHGEALNFRYFTPGLADTILMRCKCPSLKKNLLAEKENRLWLHALDHDGLSEEEIQTQQAERAHAFRTAMQRQMGFSSAFYFYETLIGGHDASATAQFIAEVQKQLQPEALKARFTALQKTALTHRDATRLEKISRFVDRLLTAMEQEFNANTDGKTPAARYEEYVGHLLAGLFERMPMAVREKVLTPKSLAVEFVDALLTHKDPNALSILRAHAAETFAFKAEPGTFFTYQDHLDGYYLVEALQKQPGFENFVENTLARLQTLPVSSTQDEGFLLHTLQNYMGHYWIKLMEKRTGKLWPDGPSPSDIKALALPEVVSAFMGKRSLHQVVAESARNIEKALALFLQNPVEDWPAAFSKIGFRPVPKTASPEIRQQETQDQKRCIQFLNEKFAQDPLAVTTFFDQEIFGHIFMASLTVDDQNCLVFREENWKVDRFFNEYFSRLSPTAKQTQATFERYLWNICEKSILMQESDDEFGFSPDELATALNHYRHHPHETNGFLATNGFSKREFFPQRYPLIAREDMVAANPLELAALYKSAQAKGMKIVVSSHCHTTATADASLQDRLTILGQRLPELIFSVPDARAQFYAKTTLDSEPSWVTALNNSI